MDTSSEPTRRRESAKDFSGECSNAVIGAVIHVLACWDECQVGLLLNFNVPTLRRGVRRVVNDFQKNDLRAFAPSRRL